MDLCSLDTVVRRHDLNEHPFYRAWRAGTLPPSSLAAYARDYAPFIASIELGWRSLGNGAHADAEREHARLWDRFRDGLEARCEVGAVAAAEAGAGALAPSPEMRALVEEAQAVFAHPVDSIGGLYAFEAQQPSTARSKLDGLAAHYGVSDRRADYFRRHADDYGERDELRGRAASLSEPDLARAVGACERLCVAMWAALDGALRASEPSPGIPKESVTQLTGGAT